MNIIIRTKDNDISWEELVTLLHEAFEERLQNGMHFTCSSVTVSELEKECDGCVVLVAIDEDTNALAGTVSMRFNDMNGGGGWAYHFNLAVSPTYKHCGIASRLFEEFQRIALSHGCHYIMSDTAVNAKSSVAWHKKNGFYPISLHAFWDNNYYSIIFRKQLKHHWLWSNRAWCALRYASISSFYKLYRNSDDSLTKFGKLVFSVRKFIKALCKR